MKSSNRTELFFLYGIDFFPLKVNNDDDEGSL